MQEHIRLLEKEKIKMKEKWVEGEKFLKQWKNDMLADVDHTETIEAFVFHCILPRCVLTPEDAMYCAFFIRKLTLEDTPYFSYLLAVRMVRLMLFQCYGMWYNATCMCFLTRLAVRQV